jgi:hypothetical protein
MGFLVEFTKAPVLEKRYATYNGPEYGGWKDITFTDIAGATTRLKDGSYTGKRSFDACKQIVDDARSLVAGGYPALWVGSAVVTTYNNDPKLREIVYPRAQDAQATEPEVPRVMKDLEDVWRYTPVSGFTKGTRGWAYVFAFVDSHGVGRQDQINGATKAETVTKLFATNLPPYVFEWVQTFPRAAEADIPAPPKPIVEYVPSQKELDAVQPFDPQEWTLMSTEEHKRQYAFDPLYREAYRKMLANEQLASAKIAEKQAREDEEAALKTVRQEFLRLDADEARKAGGR